jgi:4-amino-4-deoxy-L-arabinose transferase-like glycosyltransferase
MIKNSHLLNQQVDKDFIIKISLGIIVAAAFFLRLFNLGGQDMASDDVLYSFRSIGLVDYVASINLQSTPTTWFSERQWWQGLSFHDHPPMVFIIQWIFFKIGGINVWAARLPFAPAGTLSVFFLFFWAKNYLMSGLDCFRRWLWLLLIMQFGFPVLDI